MMSEGPGPAPCLGFLFNNLLGELFTNYIGLFVALFATVVFVRYIRSPWRSVPPGPRGLPILGNVIQLRDKKWLLGPDCKHAFSMFSFDVWVVDRDIDQDVFIGDLMYFNVLGQPIIFINSLKVAAELLDKRANIYSDRPNLIVANEILCGGLFVAFFQYGDRCVVAFSKISEDPRFHHSQVAPHYSCCTCRA